MLQILVRLVLVNRMCNVIRIMWQFVSSKNSRIEDLMVA